MSPRRGYRKFSVGCLKSERPMGLSEEMPWSLGLRGQVLAQDRSVSVVLRQMISEARRLDEWTKVVVQRRGQGLSPRRPRLRGQEDEKGPGKEAEEGGT